ncbi:MAG: response regulator [Lachnospiraceae bacterium]|nr:response regulator [Lachnospiraceae bacterium]
MFGEHFKLNEQTIPVVEEIGRHMPGGFFIYKAEMPGELLYANRAVLDIFGCEDLEDFRDLTGFTFTGMVHPEDCATVLELIDQQIAGDEERLDHVEYRIIRRDGAVRWVDDYGHYTDTDEYGGIYYVFISDITIKRERMESDLAVRSAVIQALSEAYHTVWLINDVETEAFSLYRGDTKGSTEHARPIREALGRLKYSMAKEQYISSVVAPEDRERLQEELALQNIVDRLKEKPHFNVNYLRRMEDGSDRYFRIEFARVNMPGGKLGIVCGFKDVDEDVRKGQAVQKALQEAQRAREETRVREEKARRKEMEQRLALQEKLLEEERHRAEQDKLITALASDYRGVYYIELDSDEGVCYQEHTQLEDGFKVGRHFRFSKDIADYGNRYVIPEYRQSFMEFIHPDNIRSGLLTERVISFRYKVIHRGRESFEMIRFAGVRHPEDRDDHLVHAVSMCFSDVDRETRKDLARTQALADALRAAEEANKAKTAFLSSMSHEIRTPMNAIIGLDNIALNNPDLSDETRGYLEKIGTSAQHLLRIINDILDMSRIESGRMIINNEEFCFSKTLEQVNTIIAGQCRDKGLKYESSVLGSVDEYYIGDDMKLRQIMINILGNSVKFTPAGGKVSMTVEEIAQLEDKRTLRFVFSDTGIGMSAEYLPRIFDTFSQEDSSSTSRYGSTGLGMSITKNLVELMNGRIEVESEKGEGTTFTVTVTLTHSDRTNAKPDADTRDGELKTEEITVLVIDDDPVDCDHAKLVLGHMGIHCDSASSGMEGLEMVKVRRARREPYNLLLIDWKMPDMDGLETTRRIRSLAGDDTPIIILTSYDWNEIAEEAREAGVDRFVPKPLYAQTILDEFRDAFRKKDAAAAHREVRLEGRRILLAEDVPVNAQIMMMVLSMQEMEADHAENGREAVDMFASHEAGYYDAILMDMRMPVMDGLEAAKAIRDMDRPDAEAIPIIALTANAFDEDVQRSMQAGLNAHLSKPVEPEVLFETLKGLIR